MLKNLSENAGRIFIAVGGIGILGLVVLVMFWPDMPTDSIAQETGQIGEQDSKYTWKTKSKVVAEEGLVFPRKFEDALFVIGKSSSGADILFTIERLPTGDRITITCPIPNVTPPKILTVHVSEDHCTPSVVGGSIPEINTPKACCQIRGWWMVTVSANIVKGKGYILHIPPGDVGRMLSYLTGAHTLWLHALKEDWSTITDGDRFTFRVAGFAEKFDLTTY